MIGGKMKFVGLVLACLLLGGVAHAVPPAQGVNIQTFDIWGFEASTTSETGVTVGAAGVVAAPTFSPTTTWTETSTNVAQPAYPSRMHISIRVAAGLTTAAWCTAVTLNGLNWQGTAVTEKWFPASGSAFTATTAHAYSKLTSFRATGCVQTVAVAGTFRISTTKWVGLPTPLKKASNVISMCQQDGTAGDDWDCLLGSEIDDVTISAQYNWIIAQPAGMTVTDGDVVRIRYLSTLP